MLGNDGDLRLLGEPVELVARIRPRVLIDLERQRLLHVDEREAGLLVVTELRLHHVEQAQWLTHGSFLM